MPGLLSDIGRGFADTIAAQAPANPMAGAQNTASAYARLQDAINQDYGQQQKMYESNPDNKGKSWTPPNAQERLRDQIDAMIMSGDPTLQQRGVQLFGTLKPAEKTAFQKDLSTLQAENPDLTAMDVYSKLHPGRAQTNINVNTGQEKPISISDLQKLALPNGEPVPYGTTPSEARKLGAKTVQTAAQAKTGSSTENLVNSLNTMHANIDTSANPVDATAAELRNQPGMVGSVANVALSAAGQKAKLSDVKFNQANRQMAGIVTNLMNGAGASEGERDYWASLQPKFTDDINTRKQKYNDMVDFATNMAARARDQGVRNIPSFDNVKKFEISKQQQGLPQLPSGFKWD